MGFKWFVPGLFDGSCCFGGEESAGASFLRHDGTVWTTDKDGPIMDLLAAEITARTGKDPGEHYRELVAEFGTSLLHAHRRARHARAEGSTPEAVARGRQGRDARRRADHRQADPSPRQRRPDRRPEDRDAGRLVRRSAVGHREHLQDLRGELQGRDAPGRARERGSGRSSTPRSATTHERAALPAGVPRLGPAAARHVAALAVRDRRRGPGRRGVGRPASRGRTELVAGAARWAPPAMAIRRTSRSRRSPATRS